MITKVEREEIFNKYNGHCAYCGTELIKGWHVDHIAAIERKSRYDRKKRKFVQTGNVRRPENHNLENMNPSCASCNIQKNSFTVEEFRKNIKYFVESLNKYNTQYKFAKRYGLLKETGKEVEFYYEKVRRENGLSKNQPR